MKNKRQSRLFSCSLVVSSACSVLLGSCSSFILRGFLSWRKHKESDKSLFRTKGDWCPGIMQRCVFCFLDEEVQDSKADLESKTLVVRDGRLLNSLWNIFPYVYRLPDSSSILLQQVLYKSLLIYQNHSFAKYVKKEIRRKSHPNHISARKARQISFPCQNLQLPRFFFLW